MPRCSEINDNIKKILAEIERINPAATLVAVSKFFSVEDIECAISSGIKIFGESRIQEAEEKIGALNGTHGLKWHFIGHLQTNKVKRAVELFDMMQAVDGLRLAEKINTASADRGIVADILLEVKVSGEATKFGLDPAKAAEEYAAISTLKNIRVCGLMAMAPYFADPEESRPYFREAKRVFEDIKKDSNNPAFAFLSMGMTHDYAVALQEGANIVRVGTGIFGERQY
jgi:pyridoxal phosphate enzyme (YggS family)